MTQIHVHCLGVFREIGDGFDVDVPEWWGPGPAGSYVAPWKFPDSLDFDPRTPDEHIEDRMAEEAVAFITKNRDIPFFLNYWAFSVHAPFEGKRKLLEKYEAKANPRQTQANPKPTRAKPKQTKVI